LGIRGESRPVMVNNLNKVVDFILELAALYPGISAKQMVKSPHSPNTLIKLEDCLEFEHTEVLCPATQKPLDTEKILLDAGLILGEIQKFDWFSLEPIDERWKQESSTFYKMLIKENEEILQKKIWDNLASVLKKLKFPANMLTKVEAIYNPEQLANFELYRRNLALRHQIAPSIYKKKNIDPMDSQKSQYLQSINNVIQLFDWNKEKSMLPMVPMLFLAKDNMDLYNLQGTSLSTNLFGAKSELPTTPTTPTGIKTTFSSTSSSSSLNITTLSAHSSSSSLLSAPASAPATSSAPATQTSSSNLLKQSSSPSLLNKRGPGLLSIQSSIAALVIPASVFALTVVIPGNVFPDTEILVPFAPLPGYQSRYSLVDMKTLTPVLQHSRTDKVTDKLQISHKNQAVPLFLLHT